MKLRCNCVGTLLSVIRWARKEGPDCLDSLLEALDSLDVLSDPKGVVDVYIGQHAHPTCLDDSPWMSWAGYDGNAMKTFFDQQITSGHLWYNKCTGEWIVG